MFIFCHPLFFFFISIHPSPSMHLLLAFLTTLLTSPSHALNTDLTRRHHIRQHRMSQDGDDNTYMGAASKMASDAASMLAPSFKCTMPCIDKIVDEARNDMLVPPLPGQSGTSETAAVLSTFSYAEQGGMSYTAIADKAYVALTDATDDDNGVVKMFFTVFAQGMYYNLDTLYSKVRVCFIFLFFYFFYWWLGGC